jgi:molecular chaperone DnaK
VSVSARDLGTGKGQQIRVTASGGLSAEEIQSLVAEAESNVSADKERRELAELKNKADGLLYSTERTLQEYAEHVPAEQRDAIGAQVEKTRAALEADDAGALSTAVDELSTLSYQMTEALYEHLGGEGE